MSTAQLMPRELTAILAILAVGSASLGYWLGRVRAQDALSTASKGKHAKRTDSDGEDDGNLADMKAGLFEDTKLVLVVRSDLGMSTGKIAAQCAHATLACYKALSISNPSLLRRWERTGQTKVALRCNDAEELNLLQAKAQSLNLCARSIQDAGRTQIAAGSRTVLGIGPGPARLINQVTGKLKLL